MSDFLVTLIANNNPLYSTINDEINMQNIQYEASVQEIIIPAKSLRNASE